MGGIPDLTGRTFVVTGASSGLGLATTRLLARRGAHVVMAVRDEAKGGRARAALLAAQPGASLEPRRLDLADLESVRRFAGSLRADGVRVDVLVNNAGIMMPPHALTPQGHELQFASNHLGHFALTGLLLDRLADGRDPRVVTVTSTVHRWGRLAFDDLTGARRYSRLGFYARSKLANVLFGLELDRRLRAAGSAVRSLLAHPGYAATNLLAAGSGRLLRRVVWLGNTLVASDADTGAAPQVYAATAPDAAGGQFFGPGRRGRPALARPAAAARDPALAARLWRVSEQLTGVHYDLPEVPGTAPEPQGHPR